MIDRVVRTLRALQTQRDGATAIEYALIISLVVLGIIPPLTYIGGWDHNVMARIASMLP
jgi:Flp pilus assembly pilin Flp